MRAAAPRRLRLIFSEIQASAVSRLLHRFVLCQAWLFLRKTQANGSPRLGLQLVLVPVEMLEGKRHCNLFFFNPALMDGVDNEGGATA